MTVVDDAEERVSTSGAAVPGAAMLALPSSAAADGAELLAVLEHLADQTRYVNATRAASTRRAYASDWRDFVQWCGEHRLQVLPARRRA